MTDFVRMFNGWLPAMQEDQDRRSPTSEMDDEELQAFINTMGLALHVEVSELVEETQWKPWKKPNDRFPVRNSRLKIAQEAVDVLHFLAHILNVCGVTEDDLNFEMMEKRAINEERRTGDYTYG